MQLASMEICYLPRLLTCEAIGNGNGNVSPRYLPVEKLRCRVKRSIFSSLGHEMRQNQNQNQSQSPNKNRNRMFMLGMGFVARYLAHQLIPNHWKVLGTCTSVDKQKSLEKMGLESILFNAGDADLSSLDAIRDCTHLLVSVPPAEGLGDPVLCLHQDILNREWETRNLQWICYLSSTSVYGDCGGALVDEDYPITITNERIRARLVAEKVWLDLGEYLNVTTYIFRLGGIYGPGRSALDTLLKRANVSKSQKMRGSRSFTSRVHVADICQALMASMVMPSSRNIYNIVDDDPAPRAEVFAFAQALIEERWSVQAKERLSLDSEDVTLQKQHTAERRVSNAHLKGELGVSLFHPTYRSGLKSIAETMKNPFQ